MTHFGFPYRIDRRGRTATADLDTHVRDLIEQVLFTSPGERVNRPDFGTGARQLVFAPNSDEIASAVDYLIQGALQQWLGEWIQVEKVSTESQESTLDITVTYLIRPTEERRAVSFSREF